MNDDGEGVVFLLGWVGLVDRVAAAVVVVEAGRG